MADPTRTVREQFLVEITGQNTGAGAAGGRHEVGELGELNRLFTAWVEQVYHRRSHGETGQPPLARWQAGGLFALPTPDALAEAFLWAEQRTVSKTALVSLQGNSYQVDPALAGRRVELVFDPFDLTRIEVRLAGTAVGAALPHRITRHAHAKARPEIPPAPPAATGINYALLLDDAHHSELAQRVNYAALTKTALTKTGPAGELPGQLDLLVDVSGQASDGQVAP